MPDYDFELSKIISEIKKNKARTIGLQFPEGLKNYAVKIAEEIEKKTNAKTIIFIGPTYGACDLVKEEDAKKLELDMLIHFGHLKFK
jgi:2-(3-amino-3-carboxypropyl)histidine synthase